jgi:chemotaxis protein MotB
MKMVNVIAAIGICALVFLASGCQSQLEKDLAAKNDRLADETERLRLKVRKFELQLNQCKERLATAKGLSGPEIQALQDKIALLNEDIASKLSLIRRMKEELLDGGGKLPAELSLALKSFAQDNEMVSFDEATGVLKFKSDLLFKSGSAVVVDAAKSGIASLSTIMDSEQASQFDLVVAGHTDSDPIKHSRIKHPTNWHLSSHRAISVLEMMKSNGISAKRLSVRGFADQRPIQPNDTKEGKAANRRVEIYVIATGM